MANGKNEIALTVRAENTSLRNKTSQVSVIQKAEARSRRVYTGCHEAKNVAGDSFWTREKGNKLDGLLSRSNDLDTLSLTQEAFQTLTA